MGLNTPAFKFGEGVEEPFQVVTEGLWATLGNTLAPQLNDTI